MKIVVDKRSGSWLVTWQEEDWMAWAEHGQRLLRTRVQRLSNGNQALRYARTLIGRAVIR